MLAKCWKSKFGGRLEEYIYMDGSKRYSFRDPLGRPHNVKPEEVDQIIKDWFMKGDINEQTTI